MSTLFMIFAGETDNDRDLVVRADNTAEAVKLWRDYYQEALDDAETDNGGHAIQPDRIYALRDDGVTCQALSWNTATGCELVVDNRPS